MSTLLQSLFCATAGRVRQTLTGTSPSEFSVNDGPGTHDGLDTTQDAAADTNPCNLNYAVRYQVDVFTAAGTIDFVRVNIRAKRIAAATGTVQPTIGNVDRGTPIALFTGYLDFTFDFTTNPATGLAWTAASINAYNAAGGWGFRTLIADTNNVSYVCSEISVGVYGSPPAVRVSGYTCYDRNLFDIGSPETFRLPEEAVQVRKLPPGFA